MAIHVAQGIRQMGYGVAIISRGYRGSAENVGGIVSDGRKIFMGPQQAGDEPCLIARKLRDIPVVVGKNRYGVGLQAVKQFQPDVIVLDDGFQHLGLKRDIDLVLLDYEAPFGNTHLLPRGTLREPISSVARGSACILTRCRSDRNDAASVSLDVIKKFMPHKPVFTSFHEPYCYTVRSKAQISIDGSIDRSSGHDVDGLITAPVFGFSGIARNADFQDTVRDLGFKAAGFVEFSDHHRYLERDLGAIQSKAEKSGARRLITTEKDLVRLLPHNPFTLELIVVGVKVSFGDAEPEFMSFLRNRLSD
jgi:tetraacyldisaccharide 4'-kinase